MRKKAIKNLLIQYVVDQEKLDENVLDKMKEVETDDGRESELPLKSYKWS